jgi:CDP-paratose 2-epimerase
MNKKILVTGGCGFIGSNLCIYLKKRKFSVFSLDNLSRKGSKYNLNLLKKIGIKNYNIDISDYKKIKSLPQFDVIIDCCAEAAIEISRKDIDRVVSTNLLGTLNILKKVKKENSKIIFCSTSRVNSISDINKMFKNFKYNKQLKLNKKFDENFSTKSPKSIYGLTKHASEMFIEEFSFAFGIKYIINRFGVVSGPLQFGKVDQGFVSLWIWRHIIKKKLKYIGYGGYGNQVRDILHVYDLCEIIEIQIKKINLINNRLFTIGGSRNNSLTLRKLTALCERVTKNKLKFDKVKQTSVYDIPYFVTNNKLVTKTYKWKPKRNLLDIIQDTYNWLSSQKKIIKRYM